MQAIDGHVEQLAGGVAGLLGGFLGTARSAGTQVAGRLEAGLEVSWQVPCLGSSHVVK